MTSTPHHWDEETDVVVVGYGFAGATAAMTAHDAGAKVILLEKSPEQHRGGNSRVSANIVFWPDDPEKAKAYFRAMAGPYMDNIPDVMLNVWASEMFANKIWLEGLGMTPVEIPYVEFPDFEGSDCVRVLLNGPGPIGGERLWKIIESSTVARGIDTRYETPVVSLVRDAGAILGVIASRYNERVAFRARRAVVLTCGGFENNPAMVRNYVAGLPKVYPVGTPYNTGDGVRMGIEVGADLWHMNNVSGPILSFKATNIPVAQWLNLPNGQSYIFVGADGGRFTMEGEPCSVGDAHGKVKRDGAWVQQPMPLPIYMIFDDTYRRSGRIGKAGADWDVSHGNQYNWSDDNFREVEKGWIKTADTIHDLAAKIDLVATVLEATIDRFNKSAREGIDADWGRPQATLAQIETGPFYAMELTPAFVNTQGGPRRDAEARVIGVDGEPIGRLFSAGELGSIYSFLYQGGGNIAECFAFGRVAGRNAAHSLAPVEDA